MVPEPCRYCGVDSVATCLSCQSRVCNFHMVMSVDVYSSTEALNRGARVDLFSTLIIHHHPAGQTRVERRTSEAFKVAYASGPPRCAHCREIDESQALETLRASAEAESVAFRNAFEQAGKDLGRQQSHLEMARSLLTRAQGDAPVDELRRGWTRLASLSGIPVAEFDLVEVRVQSGLTRCRVSETGSHRRAWRAGTHWTIDGHWEGGDDNDTRLLDENGDVWAVYPYRKHLDEPMHRPTISNGRRFGDVSTYWYLVSAGCGLALRRSTKSEGTANFVIDNANQVYGKSFSACVLRLSLGLLYGDGLGFEHQQCSRHAKSEN